jgi:hypothetical protein
MPEVVFGTLAHVNLREAWQHEALNFTPWLAQNLERLGEAVALDLELLEEEAGLPTTDDTFSADILARNRVDDTNVLVENQLEGSDHTHLGQILTYLAGLEARTVIWVAKSFRESHLAAIKWLNENTREEFAFFAVKLRVVRIGDSPFAPLFDVLEKPNTWERRLQSKTREKRELSDLALKRKAFWAPFLERYPDHARDGQVGGAPSRWRSCADSRIVVSYYLAQRDVGVFVRGARNESPEEVGDLLRPARETLEARLGVPFGPSPTLHYLSASHVCDYGDESQFAEIAAWLNNKIEAYETVLNELVGGAAK